MRSQIGRRGLAQNDGGASGAAPAFTNFFPNGTGLASQGQKVLNTGARPANPETVAPRLSVVLRLGSIDRFCGLSPPISERDTDAR